MNIVGIIAEYNPFHNGHAYQIKYAKEQLHADYVIVAMSGNFTQRGLPAIIDKESRAHAALLNGVDMVIEIPTIYATSSAEDFAAAGVLALSKTGLVNTLLFGAETDDIALFHRSADVLIDEPDWFKEQLNSQLANGVSFAQARANALSDELPLEFLNTPNNILGIEYVKAIKKYQLNIKPVCLKRIGAGYHDDIPVDKQNSTSLASATALRTLIRTVKIEELLEGLPINCHPIMTSKIQANELIYDDDISQLLQYQLLTHNSFDNYADCSKQLSNRIENNKKAFTNITDFNALLKTKDIAYTRISRVLCHILLGITKDDIQSGKEIGYISYLRILGFTKNGANLLTKIKSCATTPVIMQCKNAANLLSPKELKIFGYDIHATDIYNMLLTQKTNQSYPNEYSKKYTLGNI